MKKFESLGRSLSKEEMKNVLGGGDYDGAQYCNVGAFCTTYYGHWGNQISLDGYCTCFTGNARFEIYIPDNLV